MTTQTNLGGTNQAVLTTDLNSMPSSSSSNVLGAEITVTSAGYVYTEAEIYCASASNMSANAPVYVWLLRAVDGTNYEDGGASTTPTRPPDFVFAVTKAATSFRQTKQGRLPPGKFKPLIQQQTGQTWSASGNTFSIKPFTPQFT